jgi:hypothetical protein
MLVQHKFLRRSAGFGTVKLRNAHLHFQRRVANSVFFAGFKISEKVTVLVLSIFARIPFRNSRQLSVRSFLLRP